MTRWLITIVAILLPTVITWVYFTALAGYPSSFQKTAYSIGKTIQFSLPLIVLWICGSWILKRPAQWASSLVLGLLTGVIIGAAIYFFYKFVAVPFGVMDGPKTEIQARVTEIGINSFGVYLAVWIGYALGHSLMEEYYWRWFVFGNLERLISPSAAIIVSSLGFMLHHVLVLSRYFGWLSIWTLLTSLGVAVGGIVWAWLYRSKGSITGPWLSHGIVDAAIFLVGYELAFM